MDGDARSELDRRLVSARLWRILDSLTADFGESK